MMKYFTSCSVNKFYLEFKEKNKSNMKTQTSNNKKIKE